MLTRCVMRRIVFLYRFQVQSRQFKFFACHDRFSCQTPIGLRPRALVCPATSPALPAGAPAHGAAAIESCPPDNPTASPPLRNSILPVHTALSLHETPPATPARPRGPDPAAREYPPIRPGSWPRMPRLAAPWHLR